MIQEPMHNLKDEVHGHTVETNLLFLTVTMPRAALLFGTLIIGFAIGVLTAGHIVSVAKRTVGSASDKQPKAAA